jgi:hypothetical protein
MGHEAALRKAQGRKDYISSTALDFRCSTWTVREALKDLGIAPTRPATNFKRPETRPRLTKEECDQISWCPMCGHIHVYLPCEWCAHWASAKVKAHNDKQQKKRVKKRLLSKKQSWQSRRYHLRRLDSFHGGQRPTKDG